MSEFQKEAFDEFFLSDAMLNALTDVGYKRPTPVQSTAIPLVMAGIDLIVQSQTGTGKTAAFAIPVIEMLDFGPDVTVLTLAPTRELAKQVASEFERLGQYKDLGVATVYGGASYEKQYAEIEKAQVVCATPGRLLDILKRGNLDLSKLRILCLDEADEMLSMGFAEELDAIFEFLPEERQSLLFSATITEDVKALAGTMLYYPEFLTFSEDSVAAEDVEHHYFTVRGVGRARDLLKVLEYEDPETAIIFANTKDDTFMVTRFLKRHGKRAEVLNGDLPQKQREATLGALRDGKIDYLVATDVAARGIDISDLSHVFNYTLPDNAEVYIHRTGRTGRAGKSGRAVSLVSPREMGVLFNIKKMYQFPLRANELPSPHEILEAKKKRRIEDLGKALDRVQGLAYGGKLGVAESILGSADDQDRIRLVAKLLTLADGVIAGENGFEIATEPVEAVEVAAVEPTVEPESTDDEVVEVQETPSRDDEPRESRDDSRSRRGRSRRGDQRDDDKRSASRQESSDSSDSSDEASDDERPRRRRRRRSKDDAQKVETKTSDNDDRRGRGRGKNGEDSSRRGRGDDKGRSGSRSKRSSRKDSRNGDSRSNGSRKSAEPAPSDDNEFSMSKLWVNMGRNHFDSNDDVVEMVCYMAGMEPEDLGQISLESSYSYVEVREDYFYDIINAMNNQEWNGVKVAAEPARK